MERSNPLFMKKITLYVLSFYFAFSNFSVGQTRLEQSKKDLKSNNSSTQNNSSSSSSSSRSNTSNTSGGTLAEVIVEVGAVLFYYSFIGDYENENHLHSRLTPYPFKDAGVGNFEAPDSVKTGRNRFRIDFDNKFLYSDSQLYGNHINLKIRPFQYFYFQTDYHALTEKSAFTNYKTHLSIFQFNLNYDRVRLPYLNLGWNIGATYIASDVQKSGVSVGLNAEGFFGKRFSIFATGKWSKVNGQPVNFLELGGKVHSKNYYFTMGFERLKIGTPNYNFIGLGGGLYF
jgi:hypothetical protein